MSIPRPPPDFLRLMLQGLAWDARQAGVTLADVLAGVDLTRIEQAPSGRALVGIAGGKPQQYALPSIAGPTDAAILAAVAEIQQHAAKAVADNPHDDRLFCALRERFGPRRRRKA